MIKQEIQNNANAAKDNGQMQNNSLTADDHLRKMFLGGLSPNSTEETVRAFYSQFGEVVDVIIMRDPTTKRSRGFGFITFKDTTMVDRAQASRPHIIDGKSVDSKRALPRPEVGTEANSSVKKVFVGGLKEYHDEQSLKEHFHQFGNILGVKILTDKNTGRKRGFAFVEFDDYDSVDKAVLHKNHTIKYVQVDVKKSNYKQEQAKKLAQGGSGAPIGMMPPVQGAPGGYQQPAGSYNQQGTYGYGPAPAYNGWGAGGYTQTPPGAYQQPAAYGAYGAPPQNATQPQWNGTTYGAPQPSWGQNGYAAPTAGAPGAPAGVNATNGWNSAAPSTNGAPSFGSYQQTYNGGPQKAGTLQGNRMNPYSVAAAPTYGSHVISPISNSVTNLAKKPRPQY